LHNSGAVVHVPYRTTEEILAEELRIARLAFECAKATLTKLMRDIPSGLPNPDGIERLKGAGKNYRARLNAYAGALQRFNAFVLNKTVPEHLKDPESRR
jgi:hypothetical protein